MKWNGRTPCGSFGETVQFTEYISTSKEVYDEEDHVRLIFKNAQNGAELKGFNDNEAEVLYKRNTVFTVIDGWIEDDRKFFIVLEEYDETV